MKHQKSLSFINKVIAGQLELVDNQCEGKANGIKWNHQNGIIWQGSNNSQIETDSINLVFMSLSKCRTTQKRRFFRDFELWRLSLTLRLKGHDEILRVFAETKEDLSELGIPEMESIGIEIKESDLIRLISFLTVQRAQLTISGPTNDNYQERSSFEHLEIQNQLQLLTPEEANNRIYYPFIIDLQNIFHQNLKSLPGIFLEDGKSLKVNTKHSGYNFSDGSQIMYFNIEVCNNSFNPTWDPTNEEKRKPEYQIQLDLIKGDVKVYFDHDPSISPDLKEAYQANIDKIAEKIKMAYPRFLPQQFRFEKWQEIFRQFREYLKENWILSKERDSGLYLEKGESLHLVECDFHGYKKDNTIFMQLKIKGGDKKGNGITNDENLDIRYDTEIQIKTGEVRCELRNPDFLRRKIDNVDRYEENQAKLASKIQEEFCRFGSLNHIL